MIFSVGGGKGGVGKSVFSISLGVALAKSGHHVVLADLDLGAANLHTYLGILRKTPTLADFIFKKVSSLEALLVDTPQKNLKLISGAEFVPVMANPAHWMKLKIIRHVKSLPADFIIIDLGAGVHFNVLDFFGISDRGIVITIPEPGAVMNAYGFIKGALFRRVQNVFRNHPEIGPIIETEARKKEGEGGFALEWFSQKVEDVAPDMVPLITEIKGAFNPSLVINRVPEGQAHVLVRNLIALCSEKLGVSLDHCGNIPDSREISHYLLNIPKFLATREAQPFFSSMQKLAENLIQAPGISSRDTLSYADVTDEEVEEVVHFIESLDDAVFRGTSKNVWKLRMYFKPYKVVDFLINRGIKHRAFDRFVAG
jgi:flagellar biosynthesis protein FlhG